MRSIHSRFDRFLVMLALVAQVFAGPTARVPVAHAPDRSAPSCHALVAHDSAPAHASACCGSGSCHCPGLTAAATQPMPMLLVSFLRAAPARAAMSTSLPHPRAPVLLRPPIAPLPV